MQVFAKKDAQLCSAKKAKATPHPVKSHRSIQFTEHTCIDIGDCSRLVKIYSKLKKNVKNWCTDSSTRFQGRYFIERCPKSCFQCYLISECDRHQLCRNNGRCIKDEHGTYQCLCSPSTGYRGTLCEYRRVCATKPCPSKKDLCIQTYGENFVCLSRNEQEQMSWILNRSV